MLLSVLFLREVTNKKTIRVLLGIIFAITNTVMLGLIGQGKTKGLTAILKTEVWFLFNHYTKSRSKIFSCHTSKMDVSVCRTICNPVLYK